MARKPRIEIAGGLYHIITRGNNRRRIFRSHDDHNRQLVLVKEAIIVIGQESGIRTRELAEVLGLDPSAVSKRREAARARSEGSAQMAKLLKAIRSGAG